MFGDDKTNMLVAVTLVATLCAGTAIWMYLAASKKGDDEKKVEEQKVEVSAAKEETVKKADTAENGFSFGNLSKPPAKTAAAPPKVKSPKEENEGQKMSKQGTAFFKEQAFEKAIEMYGNAIAFFENLPKTDDTKKDLKVAFNNRAAAHMKLSAFSEAVRDCSSALELDRFYHKVRMRRGKAYEGQKDLKMALHDYTTVFFAEQQAGIPPNKLSCDEKHMESLLQAVGKVCAEEKYEEKKKAGKQLPSDTFITSYFVNFQHTSAPAFPEDTETDLNAKLAELPSDDGKGTLLYRKGVILKKKKKFADAAKVFEEASSYGESQEYYAEVMNECGTFKHLMGDLEAAKALLTKSAEAKPGSSNVWVKLGGLAFDSEDRESALQHFTQAVEADAEDPDVYYHRGQMYLIMEKYDECLADLRECISKSPPFGLAHMQLGIALYRQNKKDEAMAALKKAVEVSPKVPQVHNYYGEVLLAEGKVQEAAEQFEQSISVDPTFPDAYVNQGQLAIHTKGGQGIMEAVGLYNKAVEIDEQCQAAYLHHAQLKLQLGVRDEAIGLYDKAIEWAKTQAELVEICAFREAAVAHNEAALVLSGQKK
jgi:import receptor subunit TOM70